MKHSSKISYSFHIETRLQIHCLKDKGGLIIILSVISFNRVFILLTEGFEFLKTLPSFLRYRLLKFFMVNLLFNNFKTRVCSTSVYRQHMYSEKMLLQEQILSIKILLTTMMTHSYFELCGNQMKSSH